jgi:hypothetical protein
MKQHRTIVLATFLELQALFEEGQHTSSIIQFAFLFDQFI